MTQPNIDLERVERRLNDIEAINRTEDGGVTRLAYSDEETAAIDYVLDELDDRFEVYTDSIGNVFATADSDASESLYLGSHLDSVYNGGRLDGALGVVVALEAIEVADKAGSQALPPTLTIFRAEESTRFGRWGIGSRGALGMLTIEDLSATDQSNVPLWQAMQQQGFQPENLSEPSIDLDRVAGFLELHIEQGRVLDEVDEDLGIVTSIRGPVRYSVTVRGDDDHSGATPMTLRRDAVAGAAEMISAIEEIAVEAAKEGDFVATVGDIQATDGAINKVCGEVTFPLDIRSNDMAYRDDVAETICDQLTEIGDRRGLDVVVEPLDRSDPVQLDKRVIERLDEIASELNIRYRHIPSGGGHDAMNMQSAGVPTGMLFVPSVDGISHNPKEETPREAIKSAAEVLTRAIIDGVE